ncbi:DUF3313 family protein [Shewanella benthica]|nr:DUF3313 family protein [Shewanella benthica]
MKRLICSMVLLILGSAACSTQPLKLSTDSADTRDDGLVKVENSKLDMSFVRPNVNWSQYTQLYFEPVKVTNDHAPDYKPPRIDRISDGMNASYELREQDLQKMADEFHLMIQKVFNNEQPYTLVDKPGEGTLVIEAAVTDIRLSAPREDTRRSYSSMGKTYSQNSGSMVLLASIKDGGTGEVLAKAADRGQGFDQWRQNTAVFNWGDVRTVYRSWANSLKNALIQAGAETQK